MKTILTLLATLVGFLFGEETRSKTISWHSGGNPNWEGRVTYIRHKGRWLPVPAGGADMTSTTLASWTPEVWSAKALVTYRSNTVLEPLMDHSWESELGQGRGDTVNVGGFTQNNAAKNRGAGTGTFGTGATVTFDAVTEGQTQIAVNRFYYKANRAPVEAEAQVLPQYMSLLAAGRGQAIALQVDEDLGDDSTNGIDAFTTIVGQDNQDLTDDDLLEIVTDLNNVNAPQTGRVGVVSPASWASMMKIESVRNSQYAASIGNLEGDKSAGRVGRVLGFDIHMSNNLPAGTSGKKNAFFHKEALAFIGQVGLQTISGDNIADGVFKEHITFRTCGFKIMKNTFGVEVASK